MKLLKQPAFYIGLLACAGLIATVVITSMLYPSNAVVNKFEKAMSKKDAKLLQSIVLTEDGEAFDGEEFFYDWEDNLSAYYFISGENYEKLKIEILVGGEEEGQGSNEKMFPSIMVLRAEDKIFRLQGLNVQLIEKDGKQYLNEETIY